jgi:hypothetical protein
MTWRRWLAFGSLIAAGITAAPSATAGEIGLSGPGIWNGDVDAAIAGAHAVEGTGTAWVRLNLRLDVWSAPDDATPRGPQKLSWFAAYDRLIDDLTTHGVQVYALVGAESVPGDGDPNRDDFVTRYTDSFVKIVDHFKDRVRVYETYNEPNNAAVTPFYLAKMQQEIYLATKWNGGRDKDPCNQVTIVSGPLLASDHDSVPDNGALGYLEEVFAVGRSQLAWDYVHEHTGRYPLDGVGFHLYVGQGSSATGPQIAKTTQANLDALTTKMASLDDAAADKRIWLSEFGWNTDPTGDGVVSASQQADFLTAGFDVYAPDPHVAAAFWFTFQDFPAGGFGLFDTGGFGVEHRHPSYAAFTSVTAKYRPAFAAIMGADDVPARLGLGETRTVRLTVHNASGTAWSESTQDRLGAAAGCPNACATNAFGITPSAGGGYAKSPVDARVALAGDVAPGQDGAFTFAITAPKEPGDYVLALRMVRDGTTWFGDTFRRTIHVAAEEASSDAGSADADTTRKSGGGTAHGTKVSSSSPGGCAVTRCAVTSEPGGGWLEVGFLAAIATLVTRARRAGRRGSSRPD